MEHVAVEITSERPHEIAGLPTRGEVALNEESFDPGAGSRNRYALPRAVGRVAEDDVEPPGRHRGARCPRGDVHQAIAVEVSGSGEAESEPCTLVRPHQRSTVVADETDIGSAAGRS